LLNFTITCQGAGQNASPQDIAIGMDKKPYSTLVGKYPEADEDP
jgi:hypothetical protein